MKTTDASLLSQIAQDQFLSGYQMLETLADVCPDEIWYGVYSDVPFWYQVYHAAYFVDYWFRGNHPEQGFPRMFFDARIPPEFEWDVPEGVSVSRGEMREYLRLIREKLDRIFTGLTDASLASAAVQGEETVTLLDVFFSQSRHVMYNVGYCNGILREHGLQESDWYAYNETGE